MPDRENSPAYRMLPLRARRVFAAIERAIGDGSSASVSYVDFRLDHHIARVGIAMFEAARPSRPDRDRAGAAPRQRVQVLEPLAHH